MTETAATTRGSVLTLFDLTIPCDRYTLEQVKDFMRTYAKRWAFQKESGANTGYIHYQCRISLISKKRLHVMIDWIVADFPGWHVSATSNACFYNGDEFYVIKSDTRIDGPWSDREDINLQRIPRRLRVENPDWRPWQQSVIDMIGVEPDDRTCNVIYNAPGSAGKTFLCLYMMSRNLAERIPPQKDSRDIMRMVMSFPIRKCYFFDLPKATSHKDQNAMYAAIEEIKNGYAYDDRYRGRRILFDPPHVFVFTNSLPNVKLLSHDRWVFWTINSLNQLVRFEIPSEPNHGILLPVLTQFPLLNAVANLNAGANKT